MKKPCLSLKYKFSSVKFRIYYFRVLHDSKILLGHGPRKSEVSSTHKKYRVLDQHGLNRFSSSTMLLSTRLRDPVSILKYSALVVHSYDVPTTPWILTVTFLNEKTTHHTTFCVGHYVSMASFKFFLAPFRLATFRCVCWFCTTNSCFQYFE